MVTAQTDTTSKPINEASDTSLFSNEGVDSTFADSLSEAPKLNFKNLQDTVSISFLKYKHQLIDNFNVFNIVTIRNHYNTPISGNLSFFFPQSWSFFGERETQITIGPKDSLIIPIRVGVSNDVVGGGAYPVQAVFKTKDQGRFSHSFFIYKTEKSDFEFSVDKRILIINSVTKTGEVKISLKNSGNIEEFIRLEFEIGKMLNVFGLDEENDFMYIPLGIDQDTTLNFQILYRDPKTVDRNVRQGGTSNTLKIVAYSNGNTQTSSVLCRYIPNQYNNNLRDYQTPLMVGAYLNNLLANTPTAMRFEAGGMLNFDNDRSFSYYGTLLNVPLGAGSDIEIGSRRTPVIFTTNYRTKRLSLTVGNRIGIPRIPATGLGALVNYEVFKRNYITAGFARNRFTNSTSLGVRLRTSLRPLPPISLYGGYFDNRAFDQQSQFYGATISLPIKIFSLSVGANYIGTDWGPNSIYGNRSANSLGYSARAGFRFNKFDAQAGVQLNPTVGLNSNLNRNYTGRARYEINKDNRIRFLFRGQDFGTGFLDDTTSTFTRSQIYNSNLYYSTMLGGKLPFSIGPEVQIIDKANNQLLAREIRNIRSTAVRLGSFITYRFTSERSVTFFVRPGLTYTDNSIDYYRRDSVVTNVSDGLFNYNLGFTYNRNSFFRFNVSYFYGPYFYFFQAAAEQSGRVSQSLRISPIFQRTIDYDTYQLNLMSTSSILLAISDNSERYSSTFQASISTNSGWNFGTFANLYINSRENDERLRQSFRTYSLNLFARKSFYVQKKENSFFDFKAVCFKDINGNGTREENEPFIDNVLIHVKRNKALAGGTNGKYFQEKELMTDENGEILYNKMASGQYSLDIVPLKEIGELFPVNGYEQNFELFSNLTLYIPFVESYKVKGKLILERDPNSSLGDVEIDDIRITAKSADGKEFYTLTNEYGEFLLTVPSSGIYMVSVNNIYKNNFEVENNEVMVDFTGFKEFEVEFVFKERKRGINFQGGYQFKLLGGGDDETEEQEVKTEPTLPGEETPTSATDEGQPTQEQQTQPGDKTPTLDSEAEEKLWEKTEELQRQIDELKKLKQELQQMKEQGGYFPNPNIGAGVPLPSGGAPPTNVDEENPITNYRVVFGVFKERMPVSFLNQLIKFGNVETSQNDDGSSRFVSRPFETLNQAEEYGNYLREQGLSGVIVTGEVNGRPASIERVQEIRSNQ